MKKTILLLLISLTINTAQQPTLSALTKHRIGIKNNTNYRNMSNNDLTKLQTTLVQKYREYQKLSDYQEDPDQKTRYQNLQKEYDREIRKINNELINRQIKELIIHVRTFCSYIIPIAIIGKSLGL
jgi:hypothetical protein